MQDFLVIGGWAERPLSHSFVRDPNTPVNIREYPRCHVRPSHGYTFRAVRCLPFVILARKADDRRFQIFLTNLVIRPAFQLLFLLLLSVIEFC